jgi:uncharacterized protein (DUF433 family)
MTTLVNQPAPGASRSDRELIPSDSPLAPYISVNPLRMHGEPVFKGTRVPVQNLFDHLRGGDNIDRFLEGFEQVTREQALAVIDLSARGLLDGLRQL